MKTFYNIFLLDGGLLNKLVLKSSVKTPEMRLQLMKFSVKHQKILPRSNTQLYYNNGGHNNNLKTLRRFHDVDDVTVKDNQ